MPPSRRQFVQLMGGAATAAPLPFTASGKWAKIDRYPRSRFFGIGDAGENKDAATLYDRHTGGGSTLSFDVSNNQILCSIDATGTLARLCVNFGVAPLPPNAVSGGVYTSKIHGRSGPWSFSIGGAGLPEPTVCGVGLIANLIPEHSFRQGPLSIRQITFAPIDPEEPHLSPRAICCALLIGNESAQDATISLSIIHGRPENSSAAMETVAWTSSKASLAPGQSTVFEMAVLMDASPDRLPALRRRILSKPCFAWFEATLNLLLTRNGELSIPAESYFSESSIRYAELCRQSILHLPDGTFGGGFMGSDIDHRDNNWAKDTYYAVLGASYAHPELCRDAIRYYFDWGLPAKPTARGLARFPNAAAVTQSLSLAVAPIALATHYYRLSGDREFFLDNATLLDQIGRRLNDVLASRRGETFLFPSMFISNGDARGHFHTGSNVVAWFAFQGAARLALEVYGDRSLARQWSEVADRVKQALWHNCRKEGAHGLQFVEGVFEDGTFVPGHDGEESDTTLMPFYGFCSPDTPELIRHAQTGLSPLNPYYAKELDGIWWHNHGGFRPATAPAWATGLASAANRNESRRRLHRFRELTDLDGSVWWWPYKYGERDRTAVLRGNGATKCAWAAGVYLARFIETILGCRADVPARRFHWAPFLPWDSFSWQGATLGMARFDLRYNVEQDRVFLEIRNLNSSAYQAHLRIARPDGKALRKAESQQGQALGVTPASHFGLPALDLSLRLETGAAQRLHLS